MKVASAGTFESNDCLITVHHHQGLHIEIQSIVFEQFGEQIEKVIKATLAFHGIENLYVSINDKGALDYTIKARLLTAIQRLGEINA
ncbi:MAG: citrate lyase acyl carrier protein [Acholeplasmataceae bacterium]|nr:citrate lyase acyl carrier protein [Acholeplasmataceae bacterium]